MKLRLGQKVFASDGLFGELGDIIVDPISKAVTHIVAKPHDQHHQARLIPIWLVAESTRGLNVGLDTKHLRQLRTVTYSDYVKLGETIDVGDDWDIGTAAVLALPYYEVEFDMTWHDDRVGAAFDHIPKGQCEVRRSSDVVSADGKTVGHVHGMLTDRNDIKAIIVRCGLPGFRHDVLVPLVAILSVSSDRIDLSLSEEQFELLPQTEMLSASDDDVKTHLIDLRRKAEDAGHKAVDAGRSFASAARSRIRPSS